MAHLIYLIRSCSTGLHKIGVTGNWKRRGNQLEIGDKTERICVQDVGDASSLERILHKQYKDYRLPQSEWFDLGHRQVEDVISRMEFEAGRGGTVSDRLKHWAVVEPLLFAKQALVALAWLLIATASLFAGRFLYDTGNGFAILLAIAFNPFLAIAAVLYGLFVFVTSLLMLCYELLDALFYRPVKAIANFLF